MRLIDCFCELLKKVDVQFFSKSKKIGNQGQSIQKRQSTVSVQPKVIQPGTIIGDNEGFEHLVINQESDIVLLIGGLQCIINTVLGIKDDENNDSNIQVDEGPSEAEQLRIEHMQKEAQAAGK